MADLDLPVPGWPTRALLRLALGFRAWKGGGRVPSADRETAPGEHGSAAWSRDEVELRELLLGVRTILRKRLAGPRPLGSRLWAMTRAQGRWAAATDSRLPSAVDEAAASTVVAPVVAPAHGRLELLSDNGHAFDRRCALVEGARNRVDCALYYLADDDAGRAFARALKGARRRGVRVRLGVDMHTTVAKHVAVAGFHRHALVGAGALLRQLRDEGVEVHLLGDDQWSNHRKFLMVDGHTALLGGRNVADHYVGPGWTDLELLAEGGPLVAMLLPVVDHTFRLPGPPPHPTVTPRGGFGVGADLPGDGGRAFQAAVCDVLDRARESVALMHAYLAPHPWLEGAVARTVIRGVNIEVFTNSAASTDLPFMAYCNALAALRLWQRGAKVYRRRRPRATLHTKLVLGDDRRVVVGSSNLDYFSPRYCAELDVTVEDAELGQKAAEIVAAERASADTEPIAHGSEGLRALVAEARPWAPSRLTHLFFRELQ